MTFAAGVILGLFCGAFLGLLLFCALTQAKWGDEQLERSRPEDDPYAVSERANRRVRAVKRAGVTELQGHPRVGIDHVKRAPARPESPGA